MTKQKSKASTFKAKENCRQFPNKILYLDSLVVYLKFKTDPSRTLSDKIIDGKFHHQ